MEAAQPTSRLTVIKPPHGWSFPDLREIWDHRDLVYFLARRDVVTRYRQAVIGSLWVVLQPVLLAAVFSLFFGLLQKFQSDCLNGQLPPCPPNVPQIPYPLFAVVGLVMWIAFANSVNAGSESAVGGEALISKIYLPRAVIPLAAVLPSTVDFLMGFIVVVVVATIYGYPPTLHILAVPAIWSLATMISLGFVLWFSALNVKYRDVGQIVPFLTLLGLFVTPIFYGFHTIPAGWRPLAGINPMVGVMELFRWAILGTPWPGALVFIPIATSIVLLVSGALYFKRAERSFADYI